MHSEALNHLLNQIYYDLDSPAAYSNLRAVYLEARKKDPSVRMRDVREYLHNQRVYTMYKPAKIRFSRLRTRPSGLHTDWQCDLCVVDKLSNKNNGFKYILVCVDVLSRKLFAAPVKSKSSTDMIEAFEKIFATNENVLPHKIYSDRGLEFEAHKMKNYFSRKDIIKRVIYSPNIHAGVVERANRTLKGRLYRYFSQANTVRWVDVLPKILNGINNSVNRSIGIAPNSVSFENASELFNRLYKEKDDVEIKNIRNKLKVGQIVRISKEKGNFSKSYYPNYTDELFRVKWVNDARVPIVYKLEDLNGENILGVFYREEIVDTNLDETTHRIAEILKTRTTKQGVKQHYVRWVGYTDKFNSWVNDKDIII